MAKAWQARAGAIYIGDNGRTLCGAHLGASASMTGRDLSGMPVLEVTPDVVKMAAQMGEEISCEACGKRPSLLHTV